MRRRSTKHHPNIAKIVQSAQHLELLEVSSLPTSLYLLSRRLDGLQMEIVEHCCFVQPAPITKQL
jgi:hypothetical protein